MGILAPNQAPTAQPVQPGPASPNTPDTTGKMDLQKAYDKFVVNGLKILHSPEVTDGIVNRVVNSPDKIDAIGEVSLDVINRLEQSAAQNNFPVKANTILNGANTLIGEVIKIAETAGMEPLSDEQKYQAFTWAISNYISNAVKSGKITKDDLIRMGQQIGRTPEGQAIAKKAMEDDAGSAQQTGGAV